MNEKTDENLSLNATELIGELARYGISAERKSIYDDIEALRFFGADINVSDERGRGYYIGERFFQLSEIKMLIDIIQSANFVSESKSIDLINKISSFASVTDREKLKRQIVLSNRIKSSNETVYYTVDTIYRSIDEKKQIRFKYYTWDIRKNKLYKNKGQFYYVNPISLMWVDEKYYLVAFDDFTSGIKHYRVDKMENVELCELSISDSAKKLNFDSADYAKRSFNMFGGKEKEIRLRGNRDAIGIIFDRFGSDVFVVPHNDGDFTVTVKIVVSPQFYSWILGVSDLISIEGPEDVVEEYCDLCINSVKKCKKINF